MTSRLPKRIDGPRIDPMRSALMARIGQKNTKPEIVVRRILRSLGIRYSVHRKGLPGTPDICIAAGQRVVFVHGCFWHRHPDCGKATTPRVRRGYWLPKFERNVARDKQKTTALRKLGWKVTVVWECECRDVRKLRRRLAALTRSLRQTETEKGIQ